MSEWGTHTAIARARAGLGAGGPDQAVVRAILATVMDPELPVISIMDLGIVHAVDVGPDGIRVTILPTFVGCPALDLVGSAITEALAPVRVPVRVQTSFTVPWTSDRITPAGRAALAAAGIAPPAAEADVRCPHCASDRVVIDSLFGPTQCRSLWYCRGCRQPFEAMKLV